MKLLSTNRFAPCPLSAFGAPGAGRGSVLLKLPSARFPPSATSSSVPALPKCGVSVFSPGATWAWQPLPLQSPLSPFPGLDLNSCLESHPEPDSNVLLPTASLGISVLCPGEQIIFPCEQLGFLKRAGKVYRHAHPRVGQVKVKTNKQSSCLRNKRNPHGRIRSGVSAKVLSDDGAGSWLVASHSFIRGTRWAEAGWRVKRHRGYGWEAWHGLAAPHEGFRPNFTTALPPPVWLGV